MIDYIIISKSLIPLVRSCVAVMDAPWGPHFGISLKLFGNPDDILVRVLVSPTLPNNYIELLKPNAKAKQEKIEDKSRRQKARDEDTAREMLTQAENKEEWCELFVATPLVDKFLRRRPVAEGDGRVRRSHGSSHSGKCTVGQLRQMVPHHGGVC